MFVWKALLNLAGLTVGAIVALTVFFTVTAEPPKYNIDTKVGLAEMWLDADLESCARVESAAGKHWTPKHYMYKDCEYLRDPSIAHVEKLAHVLVGR